MKKSLLLPAHALPRIVHDVFAVCVAVMMALSSSPTKANTESMANEMRQLIQLTEYIGVDYPEAIEAGTVLNEEEFQEMLEFSSILVDKSKQMVAHSPTFQQVHQDALALKKAISNKQSVTAIRQLSADISTQFLALLPLPSLPSALLPPDEIRPLFTQNCSGCHGLAGKGDGPLARNLSPSPTDFTDKERALNRSILGLYESISEGIDETPMPAFKQLSDNQRWSLAFYVGGLAFESAIQPPSLDTPWSLSDIAFNTPAQLLKETNQSAQSIGWLRAHPSLLVTQDTNPLQFTQKKLIAAMNAYEHNDFSTAHNLAVTAYLDGFELVENSLDAKDSSLRRSIETNMMQLRSQLKQPERHQAIEKILAITLAQLKTAERRLVEGNLSSTTLFSASLLILLREGLEALLVVLALAMVLIKAERRDALKYVHAGWSSALLAGVMTWAAAQSLFEISGAQRETIEGAAALIAAVVLLYMGIWMHSKTHAAQWQSYIKRNIHARLKAGTLWGVASLAFVAVYREVFETVLFYQALLTQASSAQQLIVVQGFVAGATLLVLLAWTITRFSIKLPMATFFSTSTYLLLGLAFVLMGKGIGALQEAALISASPLPIDFEIDWIGVKSTWQGLAAQISVLIAFFMMFVLSKNKQHQAID